MDTTLCIDQNASQACQPEFFEFWKEWFLLFKRTGDFSLNRDILKKIGIQVISRLFESVLSLIEVLRGASDLLDT